MTPKERAVMQQALEALEEAYENGFLTGIAGLKTIDTITVMREALKPTREANEMVIDWEAINKEQVRRYKEKFGDFEQAEQPVSKEYQDHLVNQSFDWAAMAAKHQFMEGYRIGLAEMREKCAKVCDEYAADPDDDHNLSALCAKAIRAINFEGDTGFRPVSEMVAEQADGEQWSPDDMAYRPSGLSMEQAEQKPVAEAIKNNIFKAWGIK